ncbi:MAG: hypothetical protein Q4E68_06500 [Prevotellaceae bacterium]|nr:hypothetical protein [Prevotellaceae bacterium]
MNKKIIIPLIALLVLLTGGVVYLFLSLNAEKENSRQMQELAELDKKEMENEYREFSNQYSEMMTKINNDSIIAQLTQEQLRTQQLLKELQQTKSADAAEITRLKKELAQVRAVLREYVITIDSLNRLNEHLTAENARVNSALAESTRQNEALSSEKASLSEKVAIAAQLDATNINLMPLSKKGKEEKKVSKAKQLKVDFTISRNVTAQSGMKNVYVRIITPTGSVLSAGTIPYENKNIQYSIKKSIEYNGEATPVTMYWNIQEVHSAGTYQVAIFCDGQMIGSRSFSVK